MDGTLKVAVIREGGVKLAALRQDGIDWHKDGCKCGRCDTTGRSFTIGIYIIRTRPDLLMSADEMTDILAITEPETYIREASYKLAWRHAKKYCKEHGYNLCVVGDCVVSA